MNFHDFEGIKCSYRYSFMALLVKQPDILFPYNGVRQRDVDLLNHIAVTEIRRHADSPHLVFWDSHTQLAKR